jgi:RNA polymerase sigma factor (sigma-70 family)
MTQRSPEGFDAARGSRPHTIPFRTCFPRRCGFCSATEVRFRSPLPMPPPTPPTEQTRWFTEEVNPHGASLKAYLRGSFPSVRDVDDVVQESFLRVWKARAAQPIASAKAFLFKVARHLALDTIRKHRNSPLEAGCDFAALRVIDPNPDAARALLTADLRNHLADALVALPARHRNVIVLHKLQGLGHREVAAQLGLTERTAQKYCQEGMAHCARFLQARGIETFLG